MTESPRSASLPAGTRILDPGLIQPGRSFIHPVGTPFRFPPRCCLSGWGSRLPPSPARHGSCLPSFLVFRCFGFASAPPVALPAPPPHISSPGLGVLLGQVLIFSSCAGPRRLTQFLEPLLAKTQECQPRVSSKSSEDAKLRRQLIPNLPSLVRRETKGRGACLRSQRRPSLWGAGGQSGPAHGVGNGRCSPPASLSGGGVLLPQVKGSQGRRKAGR